MKVWQLNPRYERAPEWHLAADWQVTTMNC